MLDFPWIGEQNSTNGRIGGEERSIFARSSARLHPSAHARTGRPCLPRSPAPTTPSPTTSPPTRGAVFLTGTQALVRLRADAAPARPGGRARHRGLHQRLPRLAARHGRPAGVEGEEAARRRRREVPAGDQRGARRRPPCSARSASSPTPSARSRACSRCGTARARASTAPATRSSTATPTARRRTAACWWSPATTTAACRRRCRTRATWRCRRGTCRCVHPANVAEYLEFGLYGWALSRFSGAGSASRRSRKWSRAARPSTSTPIARVAAWKTRPSRARRFVARPSGLHYRWPDLPSLTIEARLPAKLDAVRAFAQGQLASTSTSSPSPQRDGRHRHLRQGALRLARGVAPPRARRSTRWPRPACASTRSASSFRSSRRAWTRSREGLEEILVIEEKAPVVEQQMQATCSTTARCSARAIVGKTRRGRRAAAVVGSASCGRRACMRGRRRLARAR